MALVRTAPLIKKALYYSIYSTLISLCCPYCLFDSTHKTRTFKSLKQLTWHLARFHSEPTIRYPFTMEEVQQAVKGIAKALEWRILK